MTNSTVAPRINLDDFGLFCAPAINLFEEMGGQIKLTPNKNEYHVAASSTPAQNYEVQRVTDVYAMYDGAPDKIPVYPMYGAPPNIDRPSQALYYATRTRERIQSEKERRASTKKEYAGSETLLSFYEPAGLDDADRVARLQVRTLCSNRHLPRHLPIGQTGTDFFLNDDVTVELSCVAGPTMPRDSVASTMPTGSARDAPVGRTPWRLISFLALNYLGLDARTPEGGARGLRELLSIFVDLSSPVNEQQIQGITKIETRPVVRSIKRANRYLSARGIEVRVTFDERSFEGTGIVLASAVLDRFFAEYAPVNAFTQLVAISEQRGELKTWPPRSGQGPLL